MNKPFLIWLLTLITEYFEGNFVVEEVPATSSHFDLEIMRALNSVEEVSLAENEESAMIAINVAGASLNPSPK